MYDFRQYVNQLNSNRTSLQSFMLQAINDHLLTLNSYNYGRNCIKGKHEG